MNDLYEMSDEELEAAFREAKTQIDTEEVTDVVEEETTAEDEVVDEIEDEEIEEAEELEQPEEDSDDDASTDDVEDGEDEEQSEESEDDELDEEVVEEEAETTEEEPKAKEEVQPIRHKFKANGKEYDLSQEEMMEMFPKVFGQAMDYTKKMQAMKPRRKDLDILESNNIKTDDLNMLVDLLKGDKGAINELIKRTGVDMLELDSEENTYTPKDYGRDESELAIKDVLDKISTDPEYVMTRRVLDSDWDDASINELVKSPGMIEALHIDVKNGTYARLQGRADMLKMRDGGRKSDLEYYWDAADLDRQEQAMVQEQARLEQERAAEQERAKLQAEQDKIATVKRQQAKRQAVKQESAKRKAATPAKRNAGASKPVNYLDDSDEAFEEWYAKLEERM